jgi:Tol biopolymer transport system component
MMADYRGFYTNSRALVIGINTYSDPRFMPLGQAEADAQSFGDVLAGPPYEFQVTRLQGTSATKNAILQALYSLRQAEADDRILVYFAGHGYTLSDRQNNETGFLACADTVPEQDFTALKLDEVIDLTRQTDAKHVCFIFDACFSGQALGLTRAPSVASDKLMVRRAYQVLSAGAGDQTVSDFQSMTAKMIDALQSGVLDSNGLTTANELGLYLQQTITRESNQSQIPQFGHVRGSQGGDFVFQVDTRVRLPGDLEDALRSSRANARLGAVVDLIALAESKDEVGGVARDRLAKIAQEDADEHVREAAKSFFDEQDALAQEDIARQRRERAQNARQITPPKMQRPVIETPSDVEVAQAQPAPAVAPPAPVKPTAKAAPKVASPKGARPSIPVWIWGVVGVIVLGGIALVVVLGSGGKNAAAPAQTNVPGVQMSGTNTPFAQAVNTQKPAVHVDAPTPTTQPVAAATTVPIAAPTGGKIAFSSDRDGNYEIYVMNADGSGITRLTNNPAHDLRPAWSPDGTRIAFDSDRDGNYEIYAMNADGSNLVNLTNNPEHDDSPAWSPDGTRIAFDSNRAAISQIYLMNADGSNIVRRTNNSVYVSDDSPAWSPDGTRIAFQITTDINSRIYVMNSDGNNVYPLTDNLANNAEPIWSPDGTHIAFVSDRDGVFGKKYQIYLMNADASNQTDLTRISADNRHPAWSPDGARIAFSSNRDGNYEIYVMNADGSNPINVTNNPASDGSPAWSPK